MVLEQALDEEMRLCIVIPIYNEEAIVNDSIETILSYAKKLPPLVTIAAVNDGSKDATGNILKDFEDRYKEDAFRLISHPDNRGYGAAIRTGAKFAIDNNYDYLIFMDSDLTNHPKYLSKFYEKMNEGWDYIKATRYSKGGAVQGVPWRHRVISRAGNLIAKILYGLPLTDFTNGFRAVKVDLFKQMQLLESGFVIIMEELYQAEYLTKSFCEIPYTLTSRKKGQGIAHFSYGPEMWMKYLKYAFKSFLRKKCR